MLLFLIPLRVGELAVVQRGCLGFLTTPWSFTEVMGAAGPKDHNTYREHWLFATEDLVPVPFPFL